MATKSLESLNHLRSILKPGDVLYTVLKHVSRSGMQREIQVVIVRDGEIVDLTWHVGQALGWSIGKHDGVKVGGAGMDMGFHLIYSLSSLLFAGKERAGCELKHRWL